ncbi:shiftless antiviral inhibitor of ribosomal frameshifting protein homolog isoform X2 [Stegostoma tigrinum]|uniref:shiftless antiviral inhibitor of ribosomal frameshifting protein homolog isoform X2 n=1 Tax=Stegostoma tigrinum TaxID=3053191 RepID=UPI00202ADF0C|nr:shiftless antiviral inhibitor of ribosomal frameshifting protein homolog isoform X2 [Stegostoma tigrinum]
MLLHCFRLFFSSLRGTISMHQDISEDDIELEKSIRRLREMFHAKVAPVPRAQSLMRKYDNDYDLVTQKIMQLKDQDDDPEGEEENQVEHGAMDANEGNVDQDLQDIVDQLKVLPLTEDNLQMFNMARRTEIPFSQRQFSCIRCDRDWWREVPERKQVSRCRYCKRRYDAVPRDQEWGLAAYTCQNCHHSFRSYGQMGVPAPCYRCRSIVFPIQIIPPRRNPSRLGNGRQNPHGCCAEDCYNRQEPYVPGTHCVHPRTRQVRGLPKVLCSSQYHESTGSTVASCISQGSSMECDIEEIIQEDLRAIPEEDEDEDEDE